MDVSAMSPAMNYLVSLEDGEIVKFTANGFESTGMFIVPLEDEMTDPQWVAGHLRATADT